MVSASQAAVATDEVRAADLIEGLSDTRSAGSFDFLAEGLAVQTTDATSQAKVAEYFAVTGALPDSGSLEWYGTQPQPGQQIVFDADGITGNLNDFNILVGEPVYGGNWWLTTGSSATAKAADPSGAENGGNGSEWFGTLADWKEALPNARMYAGGFSLGSGVKGSGVIQSITYDDATYVFTDVAEPPVVAGPEVRNVSGAVTVDRYATRRALNVRAIFVSSPAAPNTQVGERLRWVVRVNGSVVARVNQQFADRDVWIGNFARNTGKKVVTISKNGQVVRTITVRTAS